MLCLPPLCNTHLIKAFSMKFNSPFRLEPLFFSDYIFSLSVDDSYATVEVCTSFIFLLYPMTAGLGLKLFLLLVLFHVVIHWDIFHCDSAYRHPAFYPIYIVYIVDVRRRFRQRLTSSCRRYRLYHNFRRMNDFRVPPVRRHELVRIDRFKVVIPGRHF